MKKVRWTEQATRQLLEQLSTSSTMYHSLKEKNKNKQLGKEYVRFAAALNRSKPAVLFTGAKVGAKIKNLSSSWRSVHEGVAKLRNRGASTEDVDDNKGMHSSLFYHAVSVHFICPVPPLGCPFIAIVAHALPSLLRDRISDLDTVCMLDCFFLCFSLTVFSLFLFDSLHAW